MITTPDYELFKNNDYDLLLKKYQPMIKKESMKYKYLNDCSIEYEDIFQENMIIAWDAIKYIHKKIKSKKVQLNEHIYFGPFLKQRLKSYSNARLNKKKSKVNQKVSSIWDKVNESENLREYYIVDNTNIEQDVEYKILYSDFINNLSSKEKRLIFALEQYKSYTEISKKIKMSYGQVLSMSKDLKCKCKEFLMNQGYNL